MEKCKIVDSQAQEKKVRILPGQNQQNTEEVSSSSTVSESIQPANSAFPAVAKILDRYGISDRAGASIVSATLQDLGFINEDDTANVIDRNKIRRARANTRNLAT